MIFRTCPICNAAGAFATSVVSVGDGVGTVFEAGAQPATSDSERIVAGIATKFLLADRLPRGGSEEPVRLRRSFGPCGAFGNLLLGRRALRRLRKTKKL